MRTNENSGWAWQVIKDQKLADNRRDNDGACEAQLEGCLGIATEVHHVHARINDGGDDPEALEALCGPCHQRYTTQLIQERAAEKRRIKREHRRKNHPGRKDRYKDLDDEDEIREGYWHI